MSNELGQVRIVPQSPQLGATVLGLDAKEPIDDGVVQLLRDAVLQYKVIFLPEQNLTGEQQSAFGNLFDRPYETNIRARGQGLTNLTIVPHFHSDNMYHEVQPAFAMLQMLELPDVGGDTMWADLVSSYAALSQPIRDLIDPLTAVHGHPDYCLDDTALAERYGEKAGAPLTSDDVAEIGGGVLAISQFTLYGDTRKGRRPSFIGAAAPEQAEPIYEAFCAALSVPVARGVFGAHMVIEAAADGPVTLVLQREAGVNR